MSEPVLTLLKFCLVVVLYLFFFRVMRAVWAEIRDPGTAPEPSPAPAPARAAAVAPAPQAQTAWGPDLVSPPVAPAAPLRSGPPSSLRVLRPLALAGQTFRLAETEATIGRAAGCGVQLDEPTVSSQHARLFGRAGQMWIEDLGSRNGTLLNGRRVKGASPFSVGDRLGVGPQVELEVLG